jgi:hypothetical protein
VEETAGTAQDKTGTKKVVAFKKCIIAAGSQAVRLPFMPDDPRVVDSTGALALKEVPKRMLILGGGIMRSVTPDASHDPTTVETVLQCLGVQTSHDYYRCGELFENLTSHERINQKNKL